MPIRDFSEIKKYLDSPYVSMDTKRELLDNWVNQHEDGDIPADVTKYMQQYDPNSSLLQGDDTYTLTDSPEYDGHDTSTTSDHTDGTIQKAQGEIDNNPANKAQGALAGQQPPAAGGVGVKKSDEIFDAAQSALDMFRDFLPAFNEALKTECASNLQKPAAGGEFDFDRDFKKRFDEQRGIDFQRWLAEGDKLSKGSDAAANLLQSSDSSLSALYENWQGTAAKASSDQYNNSLQPAAKNLHDYLEKSGDYVNNTLVKGLYDGCHGKAGQVLNLYSDTLGSANPDIAMKVVKLINDIGKLDDDSARSHINEVAIWVDAHEGTNISQTVNNDDCDLDDSTKQAVKDACERWVNESFGPDFGNRYAQFRQICDDAVTHVNAYYDGMNQLLAGYQAPTLPQDAGNDQGGGNQGGNGAQQDGGPGPSGGGGGVPAMPGPSGTGGSTPAPTSAAQAAPTGQPAPPAVPQPGQSTTPETVKIGTGDGSIEMSSPDGQGHMKLTVDDGSGRPKTYDVDFGQGSGRPGSTPTGTSAAMPQTQQSMAHATSQPEGPTGVGGQPDDVAHVQADGSGTAVIRDGKETITIEHPQGGSNEIKVTVDDGTGKPQTYTVDYSADAASASLPTAQMSGLSAAGADSGTASPAPAGATTDQATGQEHPAAAGVSDRPLSAQSTDLPAAAASGGDQSDDGQPAPLDAGDRQPQGTVPASAGGRWTNDSDPSWGGHDLNGPADQDQGGGQAVAGGSHPDPAPGPVPGVATAGTQHSHGGDGAPGIATAPGSTDDPSHADQQGGMPMIGGPSAGGQGGDIERSSSGWRTTGHLFDDTSPAEEVRGFSHISGTLGEDSAVSRRLPPTCRGRDGEVE